MRQQQFGQLGALPEQPIDPYEATGERLPAMNDYVDAGYKYGGSSRLATPKNLFDLHARYYQEGTDEGVAIDDAIDGIGTEATDDVDDNTGNDDAEHGAAVTAAEAEAIALGDVIANIDPMGYQPNLQAVYDNPVSPGLESHLDDPKGHYTYKGSYNTPLGIVHYSYMNEKGFDDMDQDDIDSGLTSIGGDTPQDNTWLEEKLFTSPKDSGSSLFNMTETDTFLYNMTPEELQAYLSNQVAQGLSPIRGYNTPQGTYVDLTIQFPEIYAPRMQTGGEVEIENFTYDPGKIASLSMELQKEAFDV